MAKWKSPIFSDIRNKLGDNVVFSMWKGRQYFRSYVVPANPNSLAQKANRAHMAALVAQYQTVIKVTPADVIAWNAAALSQLISGYNRFIKGMRGVVISALTLAHATFTMHIDSSALPVDDLRLYVLVTGGGSVKKGPLVGVGTITDASWTDDAWTAAAGDALYVIDTKVAGATVITPANLADYGAALYMVDEAAGTAVPVVLS
jgi:hypothetical protein